MNKSRWMILYQMVNNPDDCGVYGPAGDDPKLFTTEMDAVLFAGSMASSHPEARYTVAKVG